MTEPQTAPSASTGAMLLLTSLAAEGVTRIYANVGTDYTAVIEALSVARETGTAVPELILCQHESMALSAAHGEAAVTGRATAVFVHADVGTANLGGALHNVARSRVPVLIMAGLTPTTTRGEQPGSRSSAVQFLQDVPDQAGIVRPYVRWSAEIRHAAAIPRLVARALQVARSAPGGPVYLLAPREPLLESVAVPEQHRPLPTTRLGVPVEADLLGLHGWLDASTRPLLITSYLGRDPAAADRLLACSEAYGFPIAETGPFAWTNVPTGHPHYVGAATSELVAAADHLLLVDVDVPWIPLHVAPAAGCRVVQIDLDPVKATIPMTDIPADDAFVASGGATLGALAERARGLHHDRRRARDEWVVRGRAQWLSACADARTGGQCDGALLTPAQVAGAVDEALGPRGVVISEAVSNTPTVIQQLRRGGGRALLGSGGGSLGWGGGAAVGVKLARPDSDVLWLCGDGSFVFSVPAAVYWASRRYRAPFVTVVLDNRGWNAVREATLEQHPAGAAARTGEFVADFEPAASLTAVAGAAGAKGVEVETLAELRDALTWALECSREGTSAVVQVRVAQ